MSTVRDILQDLLPGGTKPRGKWKECPQWPPDAFAVAATLVERSGCYAAARYSGGPKGLFGRGYRQEVIQAGREWMESIGPPLLAQRAWRTIATSAHRSVCDFEAFGDAAMRLLAIADEASVEMGFASPKVSRLAKFVEYGHLEFVRSRGRSKTFPSIRNTLCLQVPPEQACVQPKSRTSQIGCTLRTLSHHLALVPGTGEVETRWQLAPYGGGTGALNLLLVPFPYRMLGAVFRPTAEIDDEGSSSSFFGVDQTWIPGAPRGRAAELRKFLVGLRTEARKLVGPVHGIVLPELALPASVAKSLAQSFARDRELEIFIAGALVPKAGNPPQNCAFSALRVGRDLVHWKQAKHHRWCVEENQIRRYHLGHALSPARRWWEDISIHPRTVTFFEFRRGATICVLICEDLARIDPVQPVVRAIGPNLVVALLMDGPQREFRWPGRYATVLADDPGSAVLTLTSLGMARRSCAPGEPEPRQVALFKDSPASRVQELTLPPDSHALVLTLTSRPEENFTLDGRSDSYRGGVKGRGGTMKLTLDGVHPIRAPWVPSWMQC